MVLVDLEPVRGSEANERRPAVVVSTDALNRVAAELGRGVVTVVPITSTVHRVYPFQVVLDPGDSGLDLVSKAQAEQVRSVDIGRIGTELAVLPSQVMAALDTALRIHLEL